MRRVETEDHGKNENTHSKQPLPDTIQTSRRECTRKCSLPLLLLLTLAIAFVVIFASFTLAFILSIRLVPRTFSTPPPFCLPLPPCILYLIFLIPI